MKKFRFTTLIQLAANAFADIDLQIIRLQDAFENGQIAAAKARRIYAESLRRAYMVKGNRYYNLCAAAAKYSPEFEKYENRNNNIDSYTAQYDEYFCYWE